MRYQLIGILIAFICTCKSAPSRTVDDGLLCYISRGYQSLQDLNLNKDNPENSKFCSSTKSACYAFTGFGIGEDYPFRPDHGILLNETLFDANETTLETRINDVCGDLQFACSSEIEGSDCTSIRYVCDGSDDCSDGSDERQDYCLNRWSTEEFGRFGCLADNIGPRETEPFEKFFESFYDWRKRSFLDQSFSKGKGKINVALSDSQLTATVSTDFKGALGHAARRDPLDIKANLFIKIEDITIKLKLTGDFASAYNAFETLNNRPYWRLSLDEVLDALDGSFGIIEQSISGDLGAMYKKVSPFAKWIYEVTRSGVGLDSYRGDKINVEVMLKLDVGKDNNADVTFNGELTEAFRAFVSKGYFSALNGNVEFCEEEQKCKRLIVCGTDKCNTFEPIEWKASLLARPCPAGKWKNGQGGCQDCQCSKSGSTVYECHQETGQCSCKPGLIGKKCDKCPPKSIRYVKGDIETSDDFEEDQKECILCESRNIEGDRPEWLNQFDYEEGCFSCLSIQECKSIDQKGCPAACVAQSG